MRRTLERIHADSRLALELCVTGMHLIESYGHTVKEIQAAGLPIAGTIPVKLDGSDGRSMAHAIADELHGMVELLASRRPDIVLLLGDRGEMLAGALAALHLNIPIAHIHGGELSGTVDEPVRHAISKLSHYHFTSTEGARERLLRMGERPEQVFVTGAPGLDGIIDGARADRDALCRTYGFDVTRQIAMLVFHPVVQEAKQAATQAQTLLETLLQHGYQIIAMMPNSDAGGSAVRQLLEDSRHQQDIRVLTHLGRERYLDHLATVDLLAGNYS
ncbi:UDP-N-acetylglucosamine 2-epimerase, partial [Azoarcus taiwanensis]